jgi:hypothetical protein
MLSHPVKGVKRPKVESYEGKTPALGDSQARSLLGHLMQGHSRVSAIAPYSQPYSTMDCGARSCVASKCGM